MIHFLKEDDFPFCFRVRRLVPSRYFRVFGLIHILGLGLGCCAQGSMSPPRPRELQNISKQKQCNLNFPVSIIRFVDFTDSGFRVRHWWSAGALDWLFCAYCG